MPNTPLHKKKICMLGDFAVGKTSLTQKFVNNVFSEKYLTTVGVKIDTVYVGDTKLVVWDIAGRDSIAPINLNYLVGSAGVILVVDGTLQETVASTAELLNAVIQRLGNVPCVLAVNKSDMTSWQLSEQQIEEFKKMGLEAIATSAKTGENVELLFTNLVAMF